MTDEARLARNEYMKRWRRKNPDKVRRTNENHWERMARQIEAESAGRRCEDDNTQRD